MIDPLGSATTYRFEYLSAAAFAANGEPYAGPDAVGSVPVPAGDIGSGDVGVSVAVPAGGLSPATSYRFRSWRRTRLALLWAVWAREGVFSTLPAVRAGLPDGRVYELVTPANKEDGEDLFGAPESIEGLTSAKEGLGEATNYDLGYSSEDGNNFLLHTAAAFGSFPTSGQDSYVFSRGQEGWTVQPVASPTLAFRLGMPRSMTL